MKTYNKIRGTMKLVPDVEVNIDTVYIRTNITAIQTDDFEGWEYDEIQYGKDEYIATMVENSTALATQATATDDALNFLLTEYMPTMMG